MTAFDFQPRTRIVFGSGTIRQLGPLAQELGVRRVLVVSDPGIIKAGHTGHGVESLKHSALEVFVFDGARENPTTRHVETGVEFAREHRVDCIVGLGGGSSMDCAKGINFLYTNGGRMQDYWGEGKAAKPMLPFIAAPTTAGTGSECQRYALVADEKTHQKMACGDPKAAARIAILDPELTLTQPKAVTAITGMDALSHALESYVTIRRNAASQAFARAAWRHLVGNYETVLAQPDHLEARAGMLLGSAFAGLSIEHSMLGAAHACANPLTARYGVTHGIAIGLMLPHVLRFNASAVGDHYAELAAVAGLGPGHAGAADAIAERLETLRALARMPVRLSECKVERARLPELAGEAAKQWTGTFNPRPATEADFLRLYEAAF